MKIQLTPELEQCIADEHIAWLTTVRADGMPLPTPVWFIWHEDAFLIYSQPTALKLRNIRHNPNVSLHFNTDETGEKFTVFQAVARIDATACTSLEMSLYQTKYCDHITMIGYTPERLAHEFSVAVRVSPVRVRHQL
jgi:PPOX class probable F420-dependent enzyme